MGSLDSLIGGDFSAEFVRAVESLIQKQGGVSGLVRQFEQQGLGSIAQSWVGTGANQPISEAQINRAFGYETLRELGAKVGLSASEMAAKLAQFLPKAVDKSTSRSSATGRYPWMGTRKRS